MVSTIGAERFVACNMLLGWWKPIVKNVLYYQKQIMYLLI